MEITYEITDAINGYDVIGKRGGPLWLERTAEAWCNVPRVLAFGNRPDDWACRDLVLGSAMRSKAAWPFRRLANSGHPLLHLPSPSQIQHPSEQNTINKPLAWARAFQFFHVHALQSQIRFLASKRRRQAMLRLNCPNSLYLIDTESTTPSLVCRQNALCPFCLSREAVQLSIELTNRFSDSNTVFALISLHTLVSDDPGDLINNPRARQSCLAMKRIVTSHMRQLATRLGATGGMLSSQFLPSFGGQPYFEDGFLDLNPDAITGVLRTALLMPIPDAAAEPLLSSIRQSSEDLTVPASIAPYWGNPNFVPLRFDIDLQTTDRSSCFRSLICGTSPGMDRERRESGIEGFLVAPDWNWVPPTTLSGYLAAIGGMRTYDRFGSWRGHAVRTPSTPQLTRNPARRIRQYNRQIKLKRANERRHAEAQPTDELWNEARPILMELLSQTGRPPGRTATQKAMQQRGFSLSERDHRRLTAKFKQEVQECQD